MATAFTFRISTTPFDEDYSPSSGSRATTNFANLARGEGRRQNLRNALRMIDDRCNDLARDGNPARDRYAVELDIVSVNLLGDADRDGVGVPLIEMLDVHILDRETGERTPGITGNNFSSYVRDYDFGVLLPRLTADAPAPGFPSDFGDLHGRLFRAVVDSDAYRQRFSQPPVVCISVSTSRTYHRLGHRHPVLGVEYEQSDSSLTDRYFAKMGLQVRYFMPPGSVAPLAFYFEGDLLRDYSDLALIGTISTMEAFQKIYRPEIYNATTAAGEVYRPSLDNPDFMVTEVAYDREERSRLAATQGAFAEEHIIAPYGALLDEWTSSYAH
ncbi:putative oxygenase MesX [Microbacterium sp. NPDC003461]